MKQCIKKTLKALFLTSALALLFYSGDLQQAYKYSYVGSQVFKITNIEETGGGTGSIIKLPGGGTALITNSHVCKGVLSHSRYNRVLVTQGSKKYKLKVLKIWTKHDLCQIEAPKGYAGLYVADEAAKPGQLISAVGHPALMPLTVSTGQVIGDGDLQVAINQVETPSQCEKGTNPTLTFFGVVCVKTYKATMTNAIILGGNSGSPVVNRYGQVVGIIAFGDNSTNWGSYVPYSFLTEFLDVIAK